MKANYIIISSILILGLISCDKPEVNINVNCENLWDGLIFMDLDMVETEINNLTLDLKPKSSESDKTGHRNNLNTLIDRINNNCSGIEAELLCYACIYTYPAQSEILLKTEDTSGAIISRIIDILTPVDGILQFQNMHN